MSWTSEPSGDTGGTVGEEWRIAVVGEQVRGLLTKMHAECDILAVFKLNCQTPVS